MAIRDSEPASESMGVDVFRAKLLVYLVAAFGTGTTGALIYLNLLRISPDAAFSINWTAYTIFIVVIGGLGTIEGPLVGTVIYFVLRDTLSDYGSWYLIVFGALAIVMMLAMRQGIWGFVRQRFGIELFPVQRRLVHPSIGRAGPAR
jgi:branched-chain amino acid transport system permease protein